MLRRLSATNSTSTAAQTGTGASRADRPGSVRTPRTSGTRSVGSLRPPSPVARPPSPGPKKTGTTVNSSAARSGDPPKVLVGDERRQRSPAGADPKRAKRNSPNTARLATALASAQSPIGPSPIDGGRPARIGKTSSRLVWSRAKSAPKPIKPQRGFSFGVDAQTETDQMDAETDKDAHEIVQPAEILLSPAVRPGAPRRHRYAAVEDTPMDEVVTQKPPTPPVAASIESRSFPPISFLPNQLVELMGARYFGDEELLESVKRISPSSVRSSAENCSELQNIFMEYQMNNLTLTGETPTEKEQTAGAGPEVCAALPSQRAGAAEIGECCAICKDGIAASSILLFLPCCHFFHRNCILQWLHIQSTCPVCRNNVTNKSAKSVFGVGPPAAQLKAHAAPLLVSLQGEVGSWLGANFSAGDAVPDLHAAYLATETPAAGALPFQEAYCASDSGYDHATEPFSLKLSDPGPARLSSTWTGHATAASAYAAAAAAASAAAVTSAPAAAGGAGAGAGAAPSAAGSGAAAAAAPVGGAVAGRGGRAAVAAAAAAASAGAGVPVAEATRKPNAVAAFDGALSAALSPPRRTPHVSPPRMFVASSPLLDSQACSLLRPTPHRAAVRSSTCP
eukprot:CAMPEP_0114548874 /NCGR_PEP_ID=MMETSP0114-20121206/5222_1 /TAXON_ID=31324 /ORGANISM="Goniomonas sp, Strain m" /LENGTH=621 /DNA_ID=CAMNT_0001733509 /DNA_START=1 /DNA_END=1866 /DNA_ORIENTATION=+